MLPWTGLFLFNILCDWKKSYNIFITDWIISYIRCYVTCCIRINTMSIKTWFPSTDGITAIRPFILIDQYKNKSVLETNKYLPLLLGCNYRWNSTHILRRVWCSLVRPLQFSSRRGKSLIRTKVRNLQVYHCQYPFSFAEADIFKTYSA